MLKDQITESARTSLSLAADDTIPVDSSSQVDMSSPIRASQPNTFSMHQHTRTLTNEFEKMPDYNNDTNDIYEPAFYDFNQNQLLYLLMRPEGTSNLPYPQPAHVLTHMNGRSTNMSLTQLQYYQYAFGSDTPPQPKLNEQQDTNAQLEQEREQEQQQEQQQQQQSQQTNSGQNQEVPYQLINQSADDQSQVQVPAYDIPLPQTNSHISVNNLERDNSIPNTTIQTSFYQANQDTSGSYYGDDTSDQIPNSINESTTTFLNTLDPNQSTDALNEPLAGEFSVFGEYDVLNASTDSLPNFNRAPVRARLYQHPSVNRDLSHLQFLDVSASQRRYQSVNCPPINQASQSLEDVSFITAHNLLALSTQETVVDQSLTPTFSDISSFTSNASVQHPMATDTSMGAFDTSFSVDSVPGAVNIKTPVRPLHSPLASAMLGPSCSSHNRISKKPSLARLNTPSKKNLNKIAGALTSFEGAIGTTSARSSPSAVPLALDLSKANISCFQSQLQENSPVSSLHEFPYIRSQSQPHTHQQLQLLRTYSNASPSVAVVSTGRPSVLTSPASVSSYSGSSRTPNAFRQDPGHALLSPGIPALPELLHRQELWKKNYSLNHGREPGRSSITRRRIQKKRSAKQVKTVIGDVTEILDPKAKLMDKSEAEVGNTLDVSTNTEGVNAFEDDNDATGVKIDNAPTQASQRKSSKLKKSRSTPVLASNSHNDLISLNKDQPIVKKKYTRRRLLPRSKKGCWICRIKHLKCDEVRPSCGACLRFGLSCDYNPTKPDYVTDKELRQKKLSEISMTRKLNQALERRPSKKGASESKFT